MAVNRLLKLLLLLEYLLEIYSIVRPRYINDISLKASKCVMNITPVVEVVEAARCPDARPTAAAVACRGQDDE